MVGFLFVMRADWLPDEGIFCVEKVRRKQNAKYQGDSSFGFAKGQNDESCGLLLRIASGTQIQSDGFLCRVVKGKWVEAVVDVDHRE
jgi:hypothetical protein